MHQRFNRSHPAEGVFVFRGQPTIVFVTVCSRKRKPVLDNPIVHAAVIDSWLEASSWLVGFYLIMPNHIHSFCAPSDESHKIETWVTFWKRCLRRRLKANESLFSGAQFSSSASTKRKLFGKMELRADESGARGDWLLIQIIGFIKASLTN